MILVDTSIWIDHLRRGVPTLAEHLDRGVVLVHPFVTGELACGNLRKRNAVLSLLDEMPQAVVATHVEVRDFLEQHSLMGRGIGWVDVHLLASVYLEGGAKLWTRDKKLASVASALGVHLT